jgi:glycosyltransferase involved in cell wall biosynthesis
MVEIAAKENHMKKIVIDARELRTSTGRYVERLIHYLQQIDNGHEYIILLYPKDMDSWEPSNPNFKKLAWPFKEFTFSEQLGYWWQLRKLNADLVHFPIVQQPVLYRGKVVTTINDLTTIRFKNPTKNWLVFTAKQRVYGWVNKVVAKKSSALLTYTKFVKEDISKFAKIKSNKITVTYLAAEELSIKAEPLKLLEGKDFIMFNGRPLPHKNLYRVIEAFKIVREKYPDLLFVIAGKKDASFSSYVSFVKKLELENFIIFTDYIPDSQLKWAMEHAQAYIWASLSEGFGLPPLEAMMYGAPVVSSNATCMPEVLGDAAHYFDPTDVKDMALKIDEVLSNPVLRKKLVEKGKIQVKKYSWKRMAEQTLEIYNKVLNS